MISEVEVAADGLERFNALCYLDHNGPSVVMMVKNDEGLKLALHMDPADAKHLARQLKATVKRATAYPQRHVPHRSKEPIESCDRPVSLRGRGRKP